MKVLNLYAGIGGNRKLWKNCEVTAVEMNEDIANIYSAYFPNDKVIIGDAHEFLLKNYNNYDFIWSSPPCQTHSDIRRMGVVAGMYDAKFPDLNLWQEIIFLQYHCKKKYVIENVKPYYTPFVNPTIELERHLFWSNFVINKFKLEDTNRKHRNIEAGTVVYGFNISTYKVNNKRAVLRNCVNPDLGLYIFEQAQGIIRNEKIEADSLFGTEI